MDVVYKLASLLATQATAAARMVLELPSIIAHMATGPSTAAAEGQDDAASCTFYEGSVSHVRRRPVENSFEYPVRVALVRLDSPPSWFAAQSKDHMTAAQARAFAGTDGHVLLLTNPISAGYTQNPISVYYCHDAAGQLVRGIAEVTNTPWAERVTFAFDPSGTKVHKALHVSPFQDMQGTWLLKAPAPGKQLTLSVLVNHPTLGRFFDAHLTATRCIGSGSSARNEHASWKTFLRYGFMPQRTAVWIYWQAVKLVAKGCPIQSKPPLQQCRAMDTSKACHVRAADSGQWFVWRGATWPWHLQ